MAWGEAIKSLLMILAYFFNPKLREKREREKVWNEFKEKERKYREALLVGDPFMAARLDKDMREMRGKYKFLTA